MHAWTRRRWGRRWALTLACLLALTPLASSCSQTSGAGEKPLVLTTFTVLADMASNVAGEHLQVESVTRIGSEIHGYEPTPGDLRRAARADLILDNGLGLEAWFAQFVARLDAPHVVLSEGITPINLTDAESGEKQGHPNPHAWMSPTNATIYVDNIVAAFSELDPAHADSFRVNADAYKKQIDGIRDELTATLNTLPASQRALVSCEGAFSYLARDAGLTEAYIWPVNAEQQATPQQLARTISFVKDNKVPAVFCESTVSDKPMQRVVDATGARFGGILYVDSLSEADGPVPTYLDLIRHDARTIADGLARP